MTAPTPPPLLAVVGRRVANGLWSIDELPAGAADVVAGRRWIPIEVDLAPDTEKSQLLSMLADAGRFPDFFGHNWDALADHLTDLGWLDELDDRTGQLPGVVVLLRGAEVWAKNHPSDASVLIDIIEEATAWWSVRERPFITVWEGRRPSLPVLDLL